MSLFESVLNLGMNIALDKSQDSIDDFVRNKIDSKELRQRLIDYLSRNKKIFEYASYEEEFDYEGLCKYILDNCSSDLQTWLFDSGEAREQARAKIMRDALYHANAVHEAGKINVQKIVSDILNILADFFQRKLPKESRFMLAEMHNSIHSENKEQTKEINAHIDSAFDKFQDVSSLAAKKGRDLIKAGKFDQLADEISSFEKTIGTEHELYPSYVYALKVIDGKIQIISQPTSEQALKEYPPQITGTATASMVGPWRPISSVKDLEYADRHQIPIVLKIKSATKTLGGVKDPQQIEADRLVGTTWIFPPQPLSEVWPCNMTINGTVYLNYLLLQVQEILDDGTYIISNKKQEGASCFVELSYNENPEKQGLRFTLLRDTIKDSLLYAKIMCEFSKGASISLLWLPEDREIFSGTVSADSSGLDQEYIEQIILLFEKLIKIESYFNVQISVPDYVDGHDLDKIDYLSILISGNIFSFPWKSVEASLPVSEGTASEISGIDDNLKNIEAKEKVSMTLFNHTFTFNVTRTYYDAKLENPEKVRQKLDVLEAGDRCKITFIYGGKEEVGRVTDKLDAGE